MEGQHSVQWQQRGPRRTDIVVGLVAFALAVAVIAVVALLVLPKPPSALESLRGQIASEARIVHAGGKLVSDHETPWDNGGSTTFTNTSSRDAVENAIARGAHFIEMDFVLSTDGVPVCTHQWGTLWLGDAFADAPLSREQFLGAKQKGLFATIDADGLAELLQANPDVYVIVDVKNRDAVVYTDAENVDDAAFAQAAAALADHAGALRDRFILQIYHESQYQAARDAGFGNIIYTLYRATAEEKDPSALAAFCAGHELVGVTFPDEWMDQEGRAEELLALGVPLYTHTVDDATRTTRDLAAGIAAVYTNNI